MMATHTSGSSTSISLHLWGWQDANRLVVVNSALQSKMPILGLLQKCSLRTVVGAKCSSVRPADSILDSINLIFSPTDFSLAPAFSFAKSVG